MPAIQLPPFASMTEILTAFRALQLSDPITPSEQENIVEFARAVNAYIATQQAALPDIDPEQKLVFLDKLLLAPILAERITDDEFKKLEKIIENYCQLSLDARDFDDNEKHQIGSMLQIYGEKNDDGSPLYSERESYDAAVRAIGEAVGPKRKAVRTQWIIDVDPRVSRLQKVLHAFVSNQRLHRQLEENIALIKERDPNRQNRNDTKLLNLLYNLKDAFENNRLADFQAGYPGINIPNYVEANSTWLTAQDQLLAVYLEFANDNPSAVVANVITNNVQQLRDVALPVQTTLNDVDYSINAQKLKFCSTVLGAYVSALNADPATLTINEQARFTDKPIEDLTTFRKNAKALWSRQQQLSKMVDLLNALQQDQQVRFPDKLLFLSGKKSKIAKLQNDLHSIFNGNKVEYAAVLFDTPTMETHLTSFDNKLTLQLQEFLESVLGKCQIHLEKQNDQGNAAAPAQSQFDLDKLANLSQQDLVNFLENTQRLSRVADTFEEICKELFTFLANNANTLSQSKMATVKDSATWFFQQSDYLRSVQDPNLLFNKGAMDHKIDKLKKNSIKILTSLSEDIKSHSNFFKKLINGLLFIFGVTFVFGARFRTNTEKVLDAQKLPNQDNLLKQEINKVNGLGG